MPMSGGVIACALTACLMSAFIPARADNTYNGKSIFQIRCTLKVHPDVLKTYGEDRSTNTYFYNLGIKQVVLLDIPNISPDKITEISSRRIISKKVLPNGEEFYNTLNLQSYQLYWERRINGKTVEGTVRSCVEENV